MNYYILFRFQWTIYDSFSEEKRFGHLVVIMLLFIKVWKGTKTVHEVKIMFVKYAIKRNGYYTLANSSGRETQTFR